MHIQSINEVSLKNISNLNDINLSTLLHRLLNIEADINSLEGRVIVPLNINTADGGEDGRIEWVGGKEKTTHLPNRISVFQNKATNLYGENCKRELLVKGKKELKIQIKEVVNINGSYILFTNIPLSKKQINSRISKFREAIKEAGHANFDTFQIEIYDANYIKDWVNEHIAAVTYVQGCVDISRPLNFRTWKEWERDMAGSQIPYQTNQVLEKNIEQIRNDLKNKNIIRIIGHSGLGKTRMILETFKDDSKDPNIWAMQSQLVYYDLVIGSIETLTSFLISHKNNQSGIIVVDNCDEKSHGVIAGLINEASGFKIITIDFSYASTERSLIKIDRDNQKDIVEKIVAERFKETLRKSEWDIIVKLSEGYPQMAILFCESVEREGIKNLSSELPEEFIKKLIFGHEADSEFEYEIIKACSVLSNFGFIDDNVSPILAQSEREYLENQTSYVRTRICGKVLGVEVSPKNFYSVCLKYKKKNIIEQRGTRAMVKPTPLAINLASQWWQETPHGEIKDILAELSSDEMGNRLVERLALLDQLDKAKEIVNDLWGPKSPFGKAEVLNSELGSLLFRYVVEVNPESTVEALNDAFGDMSTEELLEVKEGRRNLVWALEKLCFRKETFATASRILFSFAVAENESWSNNSKGQFKQLFQLRLPGTEVSFKERIALLKWGLEKEDSRYTEIALLAIERGLQNSNFTRSMGAERQGSSPPLDEYDPKNLDEIKDYWTELMNMLISIAIAGKANSKTAKQKIAQAIRPLIELGYIDLVENSVNEVLVGDNEVWIEAVNNLQMTLEYGESLPESTITRIDDLINSIIPNNIESQLVVTVSKPEWHKSQKDKDGNRVDVAKLEAEYLAKKIVDENIPWVDFIPKLLTREQRQGFNFGQRMGQLINEKTAVITKSIQALNDLESESQNPEFLAGFLLGTNDKELFEKTIDEIIKNKKIQHHAFYFTRVLLGELADLIKLFKLVDEYGLSVRMFLGFQYGRSLEKLSGNEIEEFFTKISDYGNDGKWTTISLIYMYCLSENENWKNLKDFARKLISSENLIIMSDSIGHGGSQWSELTRRILFEDNEPGFASAIAQQIVEFCSSSPYNFNMQTYLRNITLLLIEKYFSVIWKILSEAIISESNSYYTLEYIIGSSNGNLDFREGLLFKFPDNYDEIIEWCKRNPKIAPERLAHMMPIDIVKDDKPTWHPLSKRLIYEFGDNDAFLEMLSRNMRSFGFVGSRVPHYVTQRMLLEELKDHNAPRVQKWVHDELKYTNMMIKREKLDDEERYIN